MAHREDIDGVGVELDDAEQVSADESPLSGPDRRSGPEIKEIEAVSSDDEDEFGKDQAEPGELVERPAKPKGTRLIIQDLKTIDDTQKDGYSRRLIRPGSTVIIRGSGDNPEDPVETWHARVNSVYFDKEEEHWCVRLNWFYRPEQLPEEIKAKYSHLAYHPRELLFSNDAFESPAQYLRHPCQMWYLPSLIRGKEPMMRAGTIDHRHTRPRPGILVRRVYDKARGKVVDLSDPKAKKIKDLGPETTAQSLLDETSAQLAKLEAYEQQFDVENNLLNVQKPPVRDCDALAADNAAKKLIELLSPGSNAIAGNEGISPVTSRLRPTIQALSKRIGWLAEDAPRKAPFTSGFTKEEHDRLMQGVNAAKIPAHAVLKSLLNCLSSAIKSKAMREYFGVQNLIRPLMVWFLRISPKDLKEVAELVPPDDQDTLRVLLLKIMQQLPYNVATDRWLKSTKCKNLVENMRHKKARSYLNSEVVDEAAKLLEYWKVEFLRLKDEQDRERMEEKQRKAALATSPEDEARARAYMSMNNRPARFGGSTPMRIMTTLPRNSISPAVNQRQPIMPPSTLPTSAGRLASGVASSSKPPSVPFNMPQPPQNNKPKPPVAAAGAVGSSKAAAGNGNWQELWDKAVLSPEGQKQLQARPRSAGEKIRPKVLLLADDGIANPAGGQQQQQQQVEVPQNAGDQDNCIDLTVDDDGEGGNAAKRVKVDHGGVDKPQQSKAPRTNGAGSSNNKVNGSAAPGLIPRRKPDVENGESKAVAKQATGAAQGAAASVKKPDAKPAAGGAKRPPPGNAGKRQTHQKLHKLLKKG